MSQKLFSMFGVDPNAPQATVPTGEFLGTGFPHIAPIKMLMAYRVNVGHAYHSSEMDEWADDKLPDWIHFRMPMGEWGYSYYVKDQETAQTFAKALGKNEQGYYHNAETTWYMAYNAADVINVEDPGDLASRWQRTGGAITSDRVVVKTYRSKKSRHIFHHIALPAFVHAAAVAAGYEVPEFDLDALKTNNMFTDEEFHALCGHPDAGKVGFEDAPRWDESALWKQRAELWAALGEEDPKKYQTGQADTKVSTTSADLDGILAIVYGQWSIPVWARTEAVANPHPSATYDSGDETRQESFRVVTALYPSEEDAIAAARKDAEENDGELCPRLSGEAPAPTSAAVDYPAIPQDYVDAAYTGPMFAEEVKKQAGQSDLVAAKNLAVDVTVIREWRAVLT